MCSGERGGLCRIKNHHHEGQTKTRTRKFVAEILFECSCVFVKEAVSTASENLCVCVCLQAALGEQCRWFTWSWALLLLLILLLVLPLVSLASVLLLLLLTSIMPSLWGVHPKVNAWNYLSRSAPPKKLIHSLYVSKILTLALTRHPRAAKRCVCPSRFHHPALIFFLSFFFSAGICWKEVCGFKSSFLCCSSCPTSLHSPPNQFSLCIVYISERDIWQISGFNYY